MKYLTILVLSLLANSSLGNHRHCDEKVNITLLRDTFFAAVQSVPTPSIENGDNLGPRFLQNFAKVVLDYGQTQMVHLYEQAVKAGDKLIDDVRKSSDNLQKTIISIDARREDPTALDVNLKGLTNQLHVFMELIPGNALIKRQALPELPPQPTEVISRTTDRTASEIFLNSAKACDDDYSTYYGFISSIFLEGWRSSRPAFNTLQTQLRNQILNRPVMAAYRAAVERVFDQSSVVESHVKSETWERFRDTGNRIIEISNDYNRSRNK